MELFGHIRAENPPVDVHFMIPADVGPDDLTGHIILLGGVVWNEITGGLSEMARLPVRQFAASGARLRRDLPRRGGGQREGILADMERRESVPCWPRMWACSPASRIRLTQVAR